MFTAPYGEPPAYVQHVASNGIWDPNKLANPPVITTTGIVTTDGTNYPVRWYDLNGNPIDIQPPQWQPLVQPVQPLPVVNVPSLTYEQIMEMIERFRSAQAAPAVPAVEEKKVEEPEEEAKPVEKKYVRVLEP